MTLMSAYNNNKNKVAGNYGNFFFGLTTLLNPKLIVEIGTCKGYSAVHFARGLKEIRNVDGTEPGKLHCYDLWEREEKKTNIATEERWTHLVPSKEDLIETLQDHEVGEFVEVYTEEAFSVLKRYDIGSIDMIHLDIGNCGDTIHRIMPQVYTKLKPGGYFLHEGGAEWRDQINWMKKFGKASLSITKSTNIYLKEHFEILVVEQYPSLTIAKKKV